MIIISSRNNRCCNADGDVLFLKKLAQVSIIMLWVGVMQVETHYPSSEVLALPKVL